MEDLVIFYRVLLAICSGIAVLWGTIKVFREIKKPQEDLKKRVENIEKNVTDLQDKLSDTQKAEEDTRQEVLNAISNLDKKIDTMQKQIAEEHKQFSILTANSLVAIGNHLISGNDIKKIEDANGSLVDYLMRN